MFKAFIISIIFGACFPTIAFSENPKAPSNKFIDGTYIDNEGLTCTLDTSDLSDGRVEAAISCLDKNGKRIFPATWVTGVIPGHLFELDLKNAGIDKISGHTNYSWGKVGSINHYSVWGCFNTNHIISARQIRKTLSLTNYQSGNKALCAINLTKK
jgi:hypothetical protein